MQPDMEEPDGPSPPDPDGTPLCPFCPSDGYTVPGPPPRVPSGPNNTLGLLGIIFGIISIPLAACCGAGIPVGIVGLVLGIIGVRNADTGRASNGRTALAGAICGFVGMILTMFALSFGIGHP